MSATPATTEGLLRQLRAVLAHRRLIGGLCAVAVLGALGLSYVLPEEYDATALVLIRPQEAIRFDPNKTGKEVLDFPVNQGVPFEVQTNSYIEVLRSRAVLEQIVRTLGLDKPKEKHHETFLARVLDECRTLVKSSALAMRDVLKYGRVVPIDPVDRAVRDLEEDLDLKGMVQTLLFEVTYSAKDPVEAAAVANGAAEILVESVSTTMREEAQGSLGFLRSQLEEKGRELTGALEELRALKERYGVFSLSEEYSEKLKVASGVASDLERTEAKLAGLLQTHTPTHPEVVAVGAERNRLARSLAELRGSIESQATMERQLEASTLRAKVAKANYELIAKEYEEARIGAAREMGAVRIVSRATPPAYPARPIKAYFALGALALGVLAGVGYALAVESGSEEGEDVDEVTEAPEARDVGALAGHTRARLPRAPTRAGEP